MPPGLERGPRGASRARTVATFILCVFGYALTLYVFFPGVMNYDARFVYSYIGKYPIGDWQSPLMSLLWGLIDPIAPGAGSMFLLIVGLYWLAFTLLALAIARHSWAALALPLLALSPPAFMLVGMIWRDVLFAAIWLLAAALVFTMHDRNSCLRFWFQLAALALVAFGVLLRPNAVPAAPILLAYILWPARWQFKRAALIYLPALAAFFFLVPLVYYGIIGAKREHPLHTMIVFDLGGITHFSKQNQFPVTWTPEQAAQLTESCYQPSEWNYYWNNGPCTFVMKRLEGEEKIFGTSVLSDAWLKAVMQHPVAYLQHRATFMATFLGGANLTMWTQDIDNPGRTVFADRPAFMRLVALHDALQPTFVFKQGTWLVLCFVLVVLGWRQRGTAEGAFVIGVCGSGVAYVATYFPVGVASDFRYSYWAVLAGLAGVVVLIAGWINARSAPAISGTA